MTHCEKCIHYPICKADSPYMPDDFVDFFPHNTDCVQFKPTADVVEVVRGKWLPYPSDAYMKCSVCGMEYYRSRMPDVVGWCPNPSCGAKMDGGENND